MFFTPFKLRRARIRFSRGDALRVALVLLALCAFASGARAADPWQAKLDAPVRFYQTTEVGVLVVGTEKSLYGLDAETGDVLWRRKGARLDETGVGAVPRTDLLLSTRERGAQTRAEAAGLLTRDA